MERPECFGIYWDISGESQCKKCGAVSECLDVFAKQTLVKHQKDLGEDATLENLADVTKVSKQAILLAFNFQNESTTDNQIVEPNEVESDTEDGDYEEVVKEPVRKAAKKKPAVVPPTMPKKRGRPPKKAIEEGGNGEDKPKRRGRPPKKAIEEGGNGEDKPKKRVMPVKEDKQPVENTPIPTPIISKPVASKEVTSKVVNLKLNPGETIELKISTI